MFEYKIDSIDWKARAGVFYTEHWSIETPIFMPVWTKSTVKWIIKGDLDEMWAQVILNNTYHLYLRPWDDVIKSFWWVHKFSSYNKPILTDSWWFQVFSLSQTGSWFKNSKSLVKINDNWVEFRSHIDWSKHLFTPEKVMGIQSNLWADIIMAFDECAPWLSDKEYAKKAMKRTHDWAIRSLEQFNKNNKLRVKEWKYLQTLFPIIQWVVYDDLRIESAKFINGLWTSWIAIWWLSVWESKEDMYRIIDVVEPYIDKNKPRYLMWVWTPEDLVETIARWIDMFDCVLPTRLWRHGTVFSSFWNIRLKNEKWKLSDEKIDKYCECKVCNNYSKWYLRHLIQENEILWMILASYHNLYFLINLTKKARKSILDNKFDDFRKSFWDNYNFS